MGIDNYVIMMLLIIFGFQEFNLMPLGKSLCCSFCLITDFEFVVIITTFMITKYDSKRMAHFPPKNLMNYRVLLVNVFTSTVISNNRWVRDLDVYCIYNA